MVTEQSSPKLTTRSFPRLTVLFIAMIIAAFAFFLRQWKVKEVTVLEGDSVLVRLKTKMSTAGDVLSAAGISLHEADIVTPDIDEPLSDHSEIVIARAYSATVFVDGHAREVFFHEGMVGDALRQAEVRLGELDRVVPHRRTPLEDGMNIDVIRVKQHTETETEMIPFATLRWPDPHLAVGEKRSVREGREGLIERVFTVTYENDELAARKLIDTRVIEHAVNEVVGVGADGDMPVLKTDDGNYYYTEMREMIATAYTPGEESTGQWADGYTFTGLRAGYGVVAVDPDVIPLGTVLYIPGYGEAIAGDIGGAIKGDRIDLGFESYEEAMEYGRRSVNVYVLAR